SRPARACDADHVVAYDDGGPTCDRNLAPLCRRHHRLKTSAGWRYRTVETGVWVWSDPHGQRFLRDDRGTTDVTPERPPPLSCALRQREGRRSQAVPGDDVVDPGDVDHLQAVLGGEGCDQSGIGWSARPDGVP